MVIKINNGSNPACSGNGDVIHMQGDNNDYKMEQILHNNNRQGQIKEDQQNISLAAKADNQTGHHT